MAKLSIIVPSYNHAKFLKERLDSIQKQTFKDWELIIIDDCSSDESIVILEDFSNTNKDKVKHFVVNKTNSGSGYFSWQRGIELAETKYIWIAETDDYSEPTFLEELVKILDQNDKLSLVFCGSNYVEDNKIIYDSNKRTKDLNVETGKCKIMSCEIFLNRMPFDTYIANGSSVVFRKPTKKIDIELFNNKQSSDLFLWSFLIQDSEFAFLNKNLNFFRRHEHSTTTQLNISSKKLIYEEKLKYLNFFEQNYKFQTFLEHYVEHFVWSNKKEIFNYKFLKQIKGIDAVDVKYFKTVIKFILVKIKSIWE